MSTSQSILLDLANQDTLDWKSFSKLLGLHPHAHKKKNDEGFDITDYSDQILAPFKDIDAASFSLTLGSGNADFSNVDQQNPPVDQFHLDIYDLDALDPLKKSLRALKLDGSYFEEIDKAEIFSYKKLYINFTQGAIEWGKRPVWASSSLSDADTKELCSALQLYAKETNEANVQKIAKLFEQFKEQNSSEKGTLTFENSKMKIRSESKGQKLDLRFFKGPVVQTLINAFGWVDPTIYRDYTRGNALQLVVSEDENLKIESMPVEMTMERFPDDTLGSNVDAYDPVEDSNFYMLVVTRIKLQK